MAPEHTKMPNRTDVTGCLFPDHSSTGCNSHLLDVSWSIL